MGSGVTRDKTFESRLETRLNGSSDGTGGHCYEILNFAVYGYNPIDQVYVLEQRVAQFHPNAILYVAHPEDSIRVARYLQQHVLGGRPMPYEHLIEVVREAGVDAKTAEPAAYQRLAPAGESVLAWVYRRLVQDARRGGMCAGLVYLPMVVDMNYAVDVSREVQLARDAGFLLFDLTGVYDVPNRNGLWIADGHSHPNARAHQLIADRLYTLMREETNDLRACTLTAEAAVTTQAPSR